MRYFAIVYSEQWPNMTFNVDSRIVKQKEFPSAKRCVELVKKQGAANQIKILSVVEYSKEDYEAFLKE